MLGYWLPAAAVLLVLYIVGGAIYRLFFHPLAKFPGPKLAAVTVWYEAYYDVVGKGQYIFKLKELHDKYGRAAQGFQDESFGCTPHIRHFTNWFTTIRCTQTTCLYDHLLLDIVPGAEYTSPRSHHPH